MEEILEIVSENNRVIGEEKRSTVHQRGLYHRAVHVLLYNTEGELYLQKRSEKKDICPGYWDLSVSEHLKPRESYEEAARRGLQEELGITATVRLLRDIHTQKNAYPNGTKDYEIVMLFRAVSDEHIMLDQEEVAEGVFFRQEEVMELTKKERMTPWFQDEWEYLNRNRKG